LLNWLLIGKGVLFLRLQFQFQLLDSLSQALDLSVSIWKRGRFYRTTIVALQPSALAIQTRVLAITLSSMHTTPVAGSCHLAALLRGHDDEPPAAEASLDGCMPTNVENMAKQG
jgi:hypothetical protein